MRPTAASTSRREPWACSPPGSATSCEFTDLFAEVDPENPASVWVAESNNLRFRIKQ